MKRNIGMFVSYVLHETLNCLLKHTCNLNNE